MEIIKEGTKRFAVNKTNVILIELLIKIIEKHIDVDAAKSFAIFLDSDFGKCFSSYFIYFILSNLPIPQAKKNKLYQEIVEEFATNGAVIGLELALDEGKELFDTFLMPILNESKILGKLINDQDLIRIVDKIAAEDNSESITNVFVTKTV